jgi:hypothetical protein
MVCGSPGMVRHTVQELRAVGFPAASIRREQFDFLQGTELDDTVEIPGSSGGRVTMSRTNPPRTDRVRQG